MRKMIKALVPFTCLLLLLSTLVLTTVPQIARSIKLGLDIKGGFEILYQVEPIDSGQQITPELLQAMGKMIEKRVNITKVSEPELTVEGTDRIRVKIAGVADPNKLRELIGRPANLTFKDESGQIVLDGHDLASNGASTGFDSLNRPEVIVKFQDASKLSEVTQHNLGREISIYLDDKEVSSAEVKTVITDGTASISGQTAASASELKDLLNAGSLPAKLIEKQVTSVAASLGEQALQMTLLAGYAATAVIFVFMLAAYRLPGLVANIALIGFAYVCFVLLFWMKAALTLSGIAGFILAIGMAVDANIITFEKIKEELKDGKSVRSAFRSGARASFSTIVDSHMTTLIAAWVLTMFGTSSIKSFAIVLIMTIIVSLLTNVFGSRFMIWLLIKDNAFPNASWFGIRKDRNPNGTWKPPFDIARNKKWFLSCSTAILIAGLLVVMIKGLNLGVDFQSGTRLDIHVGRAFETDEITEIIQEQLPSVGMKPVVKVGNDGFSAATTFSKPIPAEELHLVESKLKDVYGGQVSAEEVTVDAMIAKEMVRKAGYAIVIASAGIVLYTAIRFQLLMGIACIIALLHDILIPVALFSVFRLEIDITFIAAILTVVGYSLNDTIVIFDRIRTNLKGAALSSLHELAAVVNASLWQTMRRSLYTVLTVMISALALLWLAGDGIRLFSLALLFGLVCGAYSSIFIASQIWLMFYARKMRIRQ
ncbi:protein translocase subunit SecF [Paenibacillus contaminans]|uniref:Multifunctional fusion protein n=1 Tax=Paenibacillus contaminans TaxID=450362 RepID=A0A329LRF5_9BACL|nr:protein translocase subunit SecF [Paenibacillus contaminans]RAV09203.1 protein translocase subunit SecF [Paenibacillus contaminans]